MRGILLFFILTSCAFADVYHDYYYLPLQGAVDVTLGTALPARVNGMRSTPLLGQLGTAAHLEWRFKGGLFAGLGSRFAFVNQYSDVRSETGNWRGRYWSVVTPVVGLMTTNWRGYIEFEHLGSYTFSSVTQSGGKGYLEKPIGGRFSIQRIVDGPWLAGLNAGLIQFNTYRDSKTGFKELKDQPRLWEFSLSVTRVLLWERTRELVE